MAATASAPARAGTGGAEPSLPAQPSGSAALLALRAAGGANYRRETGVAPDDCAAVSAVEDWFDAATDRYVHPGALARAAQPVSGSWQRVGNGGGGGRRSPPYHQRASPQQPGAGMPDNTPTIGTRQRSSTQPGNLHPGTCPAWRYGKGPQQVLSRQVRGHFHVADPPPAAILKQGARLT
jgi:hypothetical protein